VTSDAGLAAHLAASAKRWTEEMLSKEAALRGYEQLVAAVLAGGSHGRVHTPLRAHARTRPAAEGNETRRDRWAA
jgi:hypothetical protein